MDTNLLVTLWPTFPHFEQFANDERISGVRLNTAKISVDQLRHDLGTFTYGATKAPLWFDVKGRQLRIAELVPNPRKPPDIILNHPIYLGRMTLGKPVEILFKAGTDKADIVALSDGGRRLSLANGPFYNLEVGESIHIRYPSLCVLGELFTEYELLKIQKARATGFTRFFLSYVECQHDVDQFRELVGRDSEIWLKIENVRGLEYVNTVFKKEPNIRLVAARGDLYVEVESPPDMLTALKLIINKDPEACVASRILLSTVSLSRNQKVNEALKLIKSEAFWGAESHDKNKIIATLASFVSHDVPSCADMCELAWLADLGYRTMMLCDEICLRQDLLELAVTIFDAFRHNYGLIPTAAHV